MATARRNEKPANFRQSSRLRAKSVKFDAPMTISAAYQIHSEERGPHWISWVTRGDAVKPDRSIVLIAASKAEAEERARKWAQSLSGIWREVLEAQLVQLAGNLRTLHQNLVIEFKWRQCVKHVHCLSDHYVDRTGEIGEMSSLSPILSG